MFEHGIQTMSYQFYSDMANKHDSLALAQTIITRYHHCFVSWLRMKMVENGLMK
jgi:hypothetical protein